MHAQITVGSPELAKKLLDVFWRHDVINGEETEPAIAAGKRVQLFHHIVNTLRPVFHSRAVQTAEGAMRFCRTDTRTGGAHKNIHRNPGPASRSWPESWERAPHIGWRPESHAT